MSLKGKKVVFTGKLSKTRAKMQAEAEAAGVDVDTAVSSNTDILVCGAQIVHNATNAKYKKAKKLGVETIEEAEYRKRLTPATKVKAPEVNPLLPNFYISMSKSKLQLLLNQLGDKNIRKSWNKTKLVDQLTQHPIEDVLSLFETDFLKKRLTLYVLPTGGSRQAVINRLTKKLSPIDPVFKNNRSKLVQLLKSDDIEVVNSGWTLLDTLVSGYSDFQNYLNLPDALDSYLELYKKFSDYPQQEEITLHIIKQLKLYNVAWIDTRKRTYAINMFGWEWEYVQHELTKEQYEFWEQTDLILGEYIHDTFDDHSVIETIPEHAQFRLAKNHPSEWARNYYAPDYRMEWHELNSLDQESGVNFDNYFTIKEVIKIGWNRHIELETIFDGSFDDLEKQGGTVVYPEKPTETTSDAPKTRYGLLISLASKGEVAQGTFYYSNDLNLTNLRAKAFLDGSTYYFSREESLSYQDGANTIPIRTELDHSWVKSDTADLFVF